MKESDRTHCPQGHPYEAWNLVPSALARGQRNCLTCSRARARKQKNLVEAAADKKRMPKHKYIRKYGQSTVNAKRVLAGDL